MNSKKQLSSSKFPEKLRLTFNSDNRWNTATQAEFFSTLANLLKIGFSLTAALKFICQTDQPLKKGTEKIIHGLQTGLDFSQCLQPLIAPQAYYQILIAEKHGQLQNVLQELAMFNRLKIKQIRKIKTMMVYPLFLCLILLILIVLIHVVVFPQIETLLPSISANRSNFFNLSLFKWGTMGVSGLLIVAVTYLLKQPPLVRASIAVKIPIFGRLFKNYLAYYLASNLATLLKNGLSVKEIYETLSSQKQASIIYALGKQLNSALTKGNSLKKVIDTHPFIPREIIKFLNSGDTIEEMANSMTAYSRLMFDEMIMTTNKLIAVIQPTMFLIIGITIITTYFQLLLPIYNSVKGLY